MKRGVKTGLLAAALALALANRSSLAEGLRYLRHMLAWQPGNVTPVDPGGDFGVCYELAGLDNAGRYELIARRLAGLGLAPVSIPVPGQPLPNLLLLLLGDGPYTLFAAHYDKSRETATYQAASDNTAAVAVLLAALGELVEPPPPAPSPKMREGGRVEPGIAAADDGPELSQCHSDSASGEESLLRRLTGRGQRETAQDNEEFRPAARAFISRLQRFLLPLRSRRNDMAFPTGPPGPGLRPLAPAGVGFLFTAAEEQGLKGASAFSRWARAEGLAVDNIINLDMLGRGRLACRPSALPGFYFWLPGLGQMVYDGRRLRRGLPYPLPDPRLVAQLKEALGDNLVVYERFAARSDSNIFQAAGWPTVCLSSENMYYLDRVWDRDADRLELLDQDHLELARRLVVGLARSPAILNTSLTRS